MAEAVAAGDAASNSSARAIRAAPSTIFRPADGGGELLLQVRQCAAGGGVDAPVERDHGGENFRHAGAIPLGQGAEGLARGTGHDDAPAAIDLDHRAARRRGQAKGFDMGEDGGFAIGDAPVDAGAVELDDGVAVFEDLGPRASAEALAGLHGYCCGPLRPMSRSARKTLE